MFIITFVSVSFLLVINVINEFMKHPLFVLTLYYTRGVLIARIARRRRWWWRRRHSLRVGFPGTGNCVHWRPWHWRQSRTLVGVTITSCRSRRRGGSSDRASIPRHVTCRSGQWTPLIRIKRAHSETLPNQCRGRRGWRGDGTGTPVIEVRGVRTGSVFLIEIDHPIRFSIAIATIRIRCSSRRRGRWRGRRRRRVSGHAASVGRLGSLPWKGRRKIASSHRRRWIFLLLWFPSRSAFWYLNVYAFPCEREKHCPSNLKSKEPLKNPL